MKKEPNHSLCSPALLSHRALFLLIGLAAMLVTFAYSSQAQAATSIGLGTADSFAVLAGSGVTNTGPSVINGDLGTSPLPAVTGFGGGGNGTVNGSTHQADAVAASAQSDLTTAYNNAAGQGPANNLATELGGQSLTPGVYNSQSGTFGITGALTLDAQGNPNAVFIFKSATTLISAADSHVNLVNGAQACNLFWQVGSSATLGTDSVFAGNILALTSISLNSGVNVNGRLLARNGAVTLINDVVTRAGCSTGGTGGGGNGPGSPGGGNGPGSPGGGNRNPGGNAPGSHPGNGIPIGITGVPVTNGNTPPPNGNNGCINTGFLAKFRVHDNVKLRSVKVFVDGKLIKSSSSKTVTVWVQLTGLRAGVNTIRVEVVDSKGRKGSIHRSFRKCAAAVTPPRFTG